MANLMNPADIANAYQGGLVFGQQQRERKRMEGEREQLRNLAPQIMQGDPAAFSQAAAINPEAATTYQSAGDQQYRRLMNVSKMMRDAINTNNPTAKQRAFQTIRPFLSQMTGGRPVPEQWDDSLLPGFEQFESRISMAQSAGGPAGGANKVVGGALVGPNGEVLYESPNKGQIVAVNDGAGGTVQMIFDPVTRSLSPLNGGQPGTMFTDANGDPLDVSGVEDPVIRRQIMENPTAYGLIPDGGSARIPEQRGGLGYAPPKPEISAAEQVRLQLAREANARSERADERAARAEQRSVSANAVTGKPPTEGERKAATLLQRLNFSQRQLEDAVSQNPDAASPGLVQSAVGAVFGDNAANAITPAERQRVEAAQLDILDAALTLGTGAAYTREQLEGYRRSYFPQIGDSQATIQDKAARLNNVIEAAKIAAGRAGPQTQAQPAQTAPVQRARNPQTGEVLVLRNGQWVPE